MCARDPLSNSLVTLDQSINLKPQDTLIEDTPQQTPVESGGTKFINLEPQDTLIEDTPQQTPVESGGWFGAWHFLIIFLLIAALVGIGYFCSHNRKKVCTGLLCHF